MGPGGVLPAEMPERGRSLVDGLDDDTAERLVAGRVGPDDAPPGYAGVAGVLQSAAGPAAPEELAGQEAALSIFRAYGPSPRARPQGRARGRPPGPARGRPHGRGRGRLVALALTGVVAAGGLWTAAGAPSPAGLPSRAGAPQSGGAGSGAPGLVTQARPMTSPVTAAGANDRASAQPSATDPSTGNGGGVTASGASPHGAKQHRPGKPPKPRPKPNPEKSKPDPEPKGNPKPKHPR
jgi:hypothetical protein